MTTDIPTMFNLEKMRAIRCTIPNCRCECFSPGKTHLRTCDTCKHGWVAHALDKLGYRSMYQMGMQVEIVQPNIVFDIASLMLYGAQATPIRLKILLDRLFSVLQHDEVLQVLHGFGWSYEDYARGYILQVKDPAGRVLDKWTVSTRDEEQVILQQFLRFGETKSIAQEIILQDTRENRDKSIVSTPKTESEIKKFIERSNMSMQSFMRTYEARHLIARPPITTYPPQSGSSTSGSSSGSRMMSPSTVPRFSPNSRDPPPIGMPLQNSSPLSGSPLTRLQGMQPFDYRRDHLSPNLSPATSEKALSHSGGSKSPENLSLSGVVSSSPSASTTPGPTISIAPLQVPVLMPIKQEVPEEIKYTLNPVPPPPSMPRPGEQDADGAINYSTKGTSASSSITSPSSNSSIVSSSASSLAAEYSSLTSSLASLNPNSASVYADRKVKHLRKSANPMKRNWQPNPAFGSTLISPSGKKRVLCTACNKTFCDKGALKIHYSAVHLKEMHKCTVEGCNMMFSSRRSRNRHSANPNPKLHMPNSKRKIPEGCTIIDENNPSAMSTSLATGLLAVPTTAMAGYNPDMKPIIPKLEPSPTSEGRIVTPEGFYLDPSMTTFIPTKIPKLDLDDGKPLALVTDKRDSTSRSSSKRKSMIPTRCAQTEEMYVSDENSIDGHHAADVSSDMDDSDIITAENLSISRISEDSKLSDCSKEDDDMTDPMDQDSDCSFSYKQEPVMEDACGDEPQNLHASENTVTSGQTHSSFHEIREKAIQQMDSISKVHLSDVCIDGCQNGTGTNEGEDDADDHVIMDGSMQKASLKTTSVNNNNNNEDEEDNDLGEDRTGDGSSSDTSIPTVSSIQGQSSDCESNDSSTEQSPGGINGLDLDIPLDRENPKKCSACGKLFQNHFGLKTHYQNVHLKLMHTCSVEGCNAAFPSKRSRDRHSGNLNLHRKLLSTSSPDTEKSPTKAIGKQNLSDEFLPRIYDSHPYPSSPYNTRFSREETNRKNEHYDHDDSDSAINSDTKISKNGPSSPLVNGTLTNGEESMTESPEPAALDGENGQDDDSPLPDPDGTVKCHICKQSFRDNLVLKEHYEKVHPKKKKVPTATLR